jgi:magnesium and cobalt transporter
MVNDRTNAVSHGVILKELSKIQVSDIMIPRSEVVMLDARLTFPEIVDIVLGDGHSRFPVYQDKIDNIIGLLYVKDLLRFFKNIEVDFDIVATLRKPLFVSENKKASELLGVFRENRVHIALVVDEYGTMLGLVSLEDILEVFVGDINDEYDLDEDTKELVALSPNEFLINPKMTLEDFNKHFRLKIQSDRYDTISGFLMDRLGYVPRSGETVEYQSVVIMVQQVDGGRLKQLLVKKIQP